LLDWEAATAAPVAAVTFGHDHRGGKQTDQDRGHHRLTKLVAEAGHVARSLSLSFGVAYLEPTERFALYLPSVRWRALLHGSAKNFAKSPGRKL
jgi:hypothetical protein